MVLSRTRVCWGILCLCESVVCNPLLEPEQLRLKKRINSAVALMSYSCWSRCVCLLKGVTVCVNLCNEASQMSSETPSALHQMPSAL